MYCTIYSFNSFNSLNADTDIWFIIIKADVFVLPDIDLMIMLRCDIFPMSPDMCHQDHVYIFMYYDVKLRVE